MLSKDFLSPKSIAIVGASIHPEKIGFSLVKNILDAGFSGKIFPVNPDADDILGLKCYPNVLRIPGPVSIAVIAVPAPVVLSVLEECGKKRIKDIVIISSGFGEIGGEGKNRQEEIIGIKEKYGMNILGPNCLGVMDSFNRLNISFGSAIGKKKDVAIVSQSGATGTAIIDWAKENGLGLSSFISLGNKIDLSENDFIDYFLTDKESKAVGLYLESITDGPKLIKDARELSKVKPVVILKSGRTSAGQRAASSHTGALAEDDLVVDTALEEAGVIRANSLEDFFEFLLGFSNLKISSSGRVLIITNAGGPSVMATDAISNTKNLSMYDFSSATKKQLIKKLPPGASINNPLDLMGDATSERFEKVFEEIKNENIDFKLIILTPQVNTDCEKIAKTLTKYKDKKTVVVLLGGKRFKETKEILSEAEIPVFGFPERAINVLEMLVKYEKYRKTKKEKTVQVKGFKRVAEKVFATDKDLIDAEIAKILAAYHIPMADSYLTISASHAIEAAKKMGYPVVLKVTSPDILHKTEFGAVKINIKDEEELRVSFQEILRNAKKHKPDAKILGVTVYKMFDSKVEIALGAKRDPIFGPVIMFGMGGIFIEVLKDFKLAIAPVSVERATEIIQSIKSFPLLNGFRGGEVVDINAIAKAISGLSSLMLDFPEIKEVDINPLRAGSKEEGILALDAKIILEKEKTLVS